MKAVPEKGAWEGNSLRCVSHSVFILYSSLSHSVTGDGTSDWGLFFLKSFKVPGCGGVCL